MRSAFTARAAPGSSNARARSGASTSSKGTLAKAFGCHGGYLAASATIDRSRALDGAGLHLHHGAAAPDRRRGDSLDPPSQGFLGRARGSGKRRRDRQGEARGGRHSDARKPFPYRARDGRRSGVYARRRAIASSSVTTSMCSRSTIRPSPRGTERLRVTPGPFHTPELITAFAEALSEIWSALGLSFARREAA